MSRNASTTVENNFVLGLITERTELRFPQNASTDLDNCVIDLYGRISRRPGLDLEDNYTNLSYTNATPLDSYSEFLWEGVGGSSTTTLLVNQHGKTLKFYDLTSSTDMGPNILATSVDLTAYIPSGSGENPANHTCQYASGFGKLTVTNPAISPIFITYSGGTITVTAISVMIRDFEGLDDGLSLLTRPTESIASLATNNPQHYYNLLNQGWFAGDALSQWDTARTDMPSNADQVGLYRASATDSFDNSIVTSKDGASSAAPRGHFILDAFNPNRTNAMLLEGFSASVDTVSLVNRTLGSNIGNMTSGGGLAAAFDNVFTTTGAASASRFNTNDGYCGKNYTSPGGSKIYGVNVCFATDLNDSHTLTIELYGKSSAPASATDGTLLGSATLAKNTATPVFIISNDTSTTWNYFWVRSNAGTGTNHEFAELQFYSALATLNSVSYQRPSTCAFFQGRAFYAGTDATKVSSKIYFTRIIENNNHFNQCYADNDPSSETFNDFLPSDGGVVSIPECGLVTKLIATQQSLLVLATNGVWVISGASGQPFQATNYTVQKLSAIGSQSPRSYVDYKGTPVWWGDDGIYTVQFDPNYNSYSVVDMTIDSIRSFITDIPAINRQSVKGCYDYEADLIYFLYNDQQDINNTISDTYNRVLVSVPRSKAFYPWSFPDSDFYVRGFAYLRDAARSDIPGIKYITTNAASSLVNATQAATYWAAVSSSSYKDWAVYANVVALDNTKEIDYTSYFTVGYYIHGETQRYFQGNYLFVFVDQDTQGSCFVSSHYDWTTSGNSGKWSSSQQIYPDWQVLQSVNYRRLKTRGKGKAMQLYFESEEGKPFSIMGWSVWETGNSNI